MAVHRVLVYWLAVAVVVALPRTARADIDATGTWAAGETAVFLQQGSSLLVCTASGFIGSGSINVVTGVFQVVFSQLPPPSSPGAQVVCSRRWDGVVAPDGNSLTATETSATTCYPPPFALCNGFCPPPVTGPPFAGVRTGPASGCCGDGVVEPGEECDDLNQDDTDCCRTNCTAAPAEQACTSDFNVCTDDVCNGAGTCQHVDNAAPCSAQCGSGSCAGGTCALTTFAPAGTSCNLDFSVCTPDTCDGAGQCAPGQGIQCGRCETCVATAGCVADVFLSCRSGTASLHITKGVTPERDMVSWRLQAPPGFTVPGDFRDPLTTTDYDLCLFMHPSAGPLGSWVIATAGNAPAGGTCGDRDCWRLRTGGPVYRDSEGTPDGLRAISLSARPGRTTTIKVKGRGTALQLPAALPVGFAKIELRPSGAFVPCWGGTVIPTVSTPTKFR